MVAITTPSTIRPAPRRQAAGRPARSLYAVPDVGVAADREVRRRLVAVVGAAALALAMVLAVAALVLTPPMTPGTTGAPATLADHVVVEGETMWSIAQDVAPAGEAATYVERLVAANGGAAVVPGQVLTVPAP